MSYDGLFRSMGITRVAGWAVWLTLATFCSGCKLLLALAGGTAGAVYVLGKQTEELNYEMSTVHKATVAGMKELKLKLSEDRADKLSAHMESEFADRTRVWIDLESIGDSRTRVAIRVGYTGNKVRSRKILDAIKQHLPQDS